LFFIPVSAYPAPVIAIATPVPVESCALFASPIAVDSPVLAADVAPALTASGLPGSNPGVTELPRHKQKTPKTPTQLT